MIIQGCILYLKDVTFLNTYKGARTMYKFTKAYDNRGAFMGRSENITEPNYPVKFHLEKVQINSGGYDKGGAYWGVYHVPLYVAYGDAENEIQEIFLRASTREDAKHKVLEIFKSAIFYR